MSRENNTSRQKLANKEFYTKQKYHMTSEVTHCRCMGLCLGFHPAPFSSVTGLFRASVRIWFWPRVSDSSLHIWSGHAFLIPVSASGSGHAFMTAAVLQYSLRLGSLTIAALSFFPTRFGYLQSSVFPQKLYIFPSSSTKNAFEAKRVLIHWEWEFKMI